jgi:hypothetical protein
VIPSNSLTAAPTFVTNSAVTVVGVADTFTLSGSTVTAYSPAVAMYASTGADGKVHVYGVNLGDIAVSPTPTQIGNLSVSALANICDFAQSQTNLTDPTTLFVLLHIAGSTGCNTPGDLHEVVHYTDTASTAPVQVGVAGFVPIYQSSGALSGLVALDPTSNNLNFYSSDNFTGPVTLVAGIAAYNALNNVSQTDHFAFGGNFVFLKVTVGTTDYLYRATGLGTASKVYTAAGKLAQDLFVAEDDTNVYFTDSTAVTTMSPAVTIYQEPLSGVGTPMTLYGTSYQQGSVYSLVGSNASVLVFDLTSFDLTTSAITSTLKTVPLGQTSTTATTIGSTFAGRISVFMGAATPDNPPADALFVSVIDTNTTGSTSTTSYSSEVLTPSGTVKQALLANSTFGTRTSELSGAIFQTKGITDTGGGYGGGSIYSIDIGSLVPSAFKATGGGPYTVPTGNVAGPFGLANTIGAGDIFDVANSTAAGIAYDLAQLRMVTISLPNTTVAAL